MKSKKLKGHNITNDLVEIYVYIIAICMFCGVYEFYKPKGLRL